MPRFAVVLIGANGVLGGRSSLRLQDAVSPAEAVRLAYPTPDRDAVHAWVHELAGTASLVEVVVDVPKWGRTRVAVSS